jgi:hypothetical protein
VQSAATEKEKGPPLFAESLFMQLLMNDYEKENSMRL